MNYNRSAEELYKRTLIQSLLYVGVSKVLQRVGELRDLQVFC